jgi:hypothetical protein
MINTETLDVKADRDRYDGVGKRLCTFMHCQGSFMLI